MAALKLIRPDGSTEKRELSRSQPLTIGRQSFNDISIAESDVAPLHCRISWNKTGFEVTAATTDGVEVNSHIVAHFNLTPGDSIRVGSVDFVFEDDSIIPKPQRQEPTIPPIPAPAASHRSRAKHELAEKPAEDLSLFSGEIQTESQAVMEALFADEAEDEGVGETASRNQPGRKPGTAKTTEPARVARPGEQEILKSPLVLGLTFGGLTLLLVTGIFWFLISREQSNRQYDRAVAEMNDGQYSQSITSFERFIAQNPNHGLRRLADRGLGKALILKEISGAVPAWKRGLERLTDLIKAHRNESEFSDLHSSLFQLSDQIALGAAKSAESSRDAELLVVSKEAQGLLERYADPSAPPTGTIGRINEQRVKADRAIQKQKTFDVAMKTVDAAIADRKPMTALSERERLVRQFPDFVSSSRVKETLQKALDLERSMVLVDETEQSVETVDETIRTNESILGLLQSRSRADEVSQGRIVFAVAKDSCYAIDAATGELIWRRVVGLDSPFFPLVTAGAQPSVVLFDTRTQSILSCQPLTGKLIWKQSLKARAIGGPLIHEGQIYQAIEGHSLIRIDLDTGRISAKVTLSQNLATSPALSRDGEYLLVPGQMAMIYSLALRTMSTRQPLAAVATTFTDHSAGSISAPVLSMGRLLLICENDLADSAKLRLWDASNPSETLIELASARTNGQVRDVPVLRGNQLVIPSAGEQFAAFVVTDDAGRAGIAPIGQYKAIQSGNRIEVPLFVAMGSDGQFWCAGSAFRKFEINSNSIRMESNSTAPGIASQPLQQVGEHLFVGRKSRFSDAVTFSAVEREKLVIPWRCIVGDEPLAMVATRDGGIVWAGESGSLYSLGKNRISQGGVDLKSGTDLDLPANIVKPIRATVLDDQRLVITAAGETVQLFLLNQIGQVVAKYPIDELPEVDPLLLDCGLVLPLSSRLKLLPLTPGQKPTQDWLAPIGENIEHHWAQLIRVDGRELIACDRSGRLSRIQFREGDVPHLAEVSKLQLPHPVDVPLALRGDFLYVADASGTCRQLNVHSFDADGERSMPAPIRNLWATEANMIVEAGDGRLHSLADGKGLQERWTYDLNRLSPIGPVVTQGDAFWFACRNGTILVLNSESGEEIRRIELPQTLSLGLRRFHEKLFAVACDGTLYRLDD